MMATESSPVFSKINYPAVCGGVVYFGVELQKFGIMLPALIHFFRSEFCLAWSGATDTFGICCQKQPEL